MDIHDPKKLIEALATARAAMAPPTSGSAPTDQEVAQGGATNHTS